MSRRWKIALWFAGSATAAIIAVLVVTAVEISRHARDFVSDWLSHEYNSVVEISSFDVTVPFPLVQIKADNLVLHFQGRQDIPPLLAVKRVTIRTPIWDLLENPRRIQFVHLEGLEMNIPPRDETTNGTDPKTLMKKFHLARFDEILSENAVLKLGTSKPRKSPLEFDIQPLNLHSVGTDGALAFRATLSNPTPPGEIVSSGTFGPWNGEAPSLTPVSGTYVFEHADLGVFRGIGGILSSKGNYQGVLEQIEATGTTDTPDFRVTRAGHPVHLTTSFQATVNGTDGNTYLHPVEAQLGKTVFRAQGKIEGIAGKKGKTITLDLSIDNGRIDDVLQLAVKVSPPMTGPIRLQTKFTLVPGPQEIPDRLELDGHFELESVHFTNSAQQQKLHNMSKRSLGKAKQVEDPTNAISSDDVASAMKGNFHLREGILRLSNFGFEIPGANVQLDGTYTLGEESLNLHGKLQMQAKLSQSVTGVKSVLLKAVDPFFSKNGRTVLPIKITGPVQHPHYGLDLHHKAEIEKADK